MLLIVVASSLITLVAVLFGAGIYVILAVLEESDEDESRTILGLDSHDFTSTPVVSPYDASSSGNEHKQTIKLIEGVDCYCTLRERAEAAVEEASANEAAAPNEGSLKNDASNLSEMLDDSETASSEPTAELGGLSREDIQSARLNSKLLKATEEQRESAPGALESLAADELPVADGTQGTSDRPGQFVDWQSQQPSAQKSRISTLLGVALAKKVFDDLDSREMPLGGTALHWCRTRPILDTLVKLGIPLDSLNGRRETALHVAIRRHKLQILIGLVIHGADVEARNELEETPLIVACKVRNIFAVQMLLVLEANPNAEDKFGFTARHHTAIICENNKAQIPKTPSAAHLILAMLNEIGARRCQVQPSRLTPRIGSKTCCSARGRSRIFASVNAKTPNDMSKAPRRQLTPPKGRLAHAAACPEGCSSSGIYNGNSYNRWPNFKRESLYKRHMFNDIIESHLSRARQNRNGGSYRGGRESPEKSSRLLCVDGGGLRGVIVCQILIELEKYVKRPIISYFDWIGGTSVGAFIACALCIGVPLNELRQICFDVKDEVFCGGRPYNSQFIEQVLKRTFGTERRLSEIKHKKLAVTTVLADREPCQLRLFRNFISPNRLLERYGYAPDTFNNMSGHSVVSKAPHPDGSSEKPPTTTTKITDVGGRQIPNDLETNHVQMKNASERRAKNAKTGRIPASELHVDGGITPSDTDTQNQEQVLDENDPDPIIWKVVRASTAAPFFFKPYGPYLDGGIISNNPTLDMLNEFESYQKVRKFLLGHVKPDNVHLMDDPLYADCESTSKLNLVVSLGTGRGRVISKQAMVDFNQVATGFSTVFSPIELVRSIRAAREIFRKLMQQSCHTDDYILDRAQAWCSSLEIPYFRINPPLATIFSIDDKRDEQLINALWQTKLYMIAMKDQLSELAHLLDGPA